MQANWHGRSGSGRSDFGTRPGPGRTRSSSACATPPTWHRLPPLRCCYYHCCCCWSAARHAATRSSTRRGLPAAMARSRCPTTIARRCGSCAGCWTTTSCRPSSPARGAPSCGSAASSVRPTQRATAPGLAGSAQCRGGCWAQAQCSLRARCWRTGRAETAVWEPDSRWVAAVAVVG